MEKTKIFSMQNQFADYMPEVDWKDNQIIKKNEAIKAANTSSTRDEKETF